MASLDEKINEVIEQGKSVYELYNSWPKLSEAINSMIEVGKWEHLTNKHPKQWYKILCGNGTYYYDWWCELGQILTHIQESKDNSNIAKAKTFYGKINNGHRLGNVNYSVSKLQDTIIPFLYKAAYNLSFSKNVNFQLEYNWNKCLEKFITKDIDVALHNFPTVLAYSKHINGKNNMFFFPFFTFSGYGLCIKTSSIIKFASIKQGKKDFTFDDLSLPQKKEFLETANIILERNSDFEWALKKFSEKFQCDWGLISSHIIDTEINKAKVSFLNDSTISIYSTNSIHTADLKNKADIEIIEGFTEHHNYNGIMCTMEYYTNNIDIVHGLISIWFNNIRLFLNDLNILKNPNNSKDFANFHIISLLDKLNDLTFSNVSIFDFINSYENNFFFPSVDSAKESFNNNVLSSDSAIKNNIQIAEIQLNYPSLSSNDITDEIQEQIDFIKNQLETFKF